MSAIKNHFHEEICNGQSNQHEDDAYFYEKFKQEQEQFSDENVEKAEFFATFDRTGTYPM